MIGLSIIIFILGYVFITLEGVIKMNKAATALITGITLWIIYLVFSLEAYAYSDLSLELGKISEILFFLLAAMAIVEVVDSRKGFHLVTSFLQFTSIKTLWWTVGFITFFLSALIDNLTTTIVMITILSRIVNNKTNIWLFSSMVILASNAGGAWSPVGDVTTTMLWIGEQISTSQIVLKLFLPSLVCLICALYMLGRQLIPENYQIEKTKITNSSKLILYLGIGIMLLVPLAKVTLNIPPILSMLLGLALLWIIVEILDKRDPKSAGITTALQRIDTPTILFFLGILLSISALEKMNVLEHTATWITKSNQNIYWINGILGIVSAMVDNVPLVAGMQGMFSMNQYSQDHPFWHLLAYCAGTGGSILIIGSAAGVAAMGMQKIDFIWYLKKVSITAIVSYFAGILVFYLLQIQ
jgi:Na+/H+ antiporter NhaD/arsenite permease-like protein